MPGLVCQQTESRHSEVVRPIFSGREPASEGILKRTLRRFKLGIAKTMLGFAIATSAVGCGSEKSAPTQQQNEAVLTQAIVTDNEGKARFEINGTHFMLSVLDSEKSEPVSGLIVILSVKWNTGIYIVLDPEGKYYPRILDAFNFNQLQSALKADDIAGDNTQNKDVKVENACFLNNYELITGKSINELYNDLEKYHNDPTGESMLTTHFYLKEDNVSLSELNDIIKQVLGIAINDALNKGITGIIKATVLAGWKTGKTAGQVGSGVSIALAVGDVCAALETLDWGNYYRKLCYAEDDKFEVWKARTTLPDIGITVPFVDIELGLLTNPIILVLPKEKNDYTVGEEWIPPSATINGEIELISQPLLPHSFTAYLKHVDGKIPTGVKDIQYDIVMKSGTFWFKPSACESSNPTYTLELVSDSIWVDGPQTKIRVKDKGEYRVKFLVDPNCAKEEYSTFYEDKDNDGFGDEFNLAVACSPLGGYVDISGDMDDDNAQVYPSIMSPECSYAAETTGMQITDVIGTTEDYAVVKGVKGISSPVYYYLVDLRAKTIEEIIFPEDFGSPAVIGVWNNQLVVNAYVPASDIWASHIIMLYDPNTQNYTKLVDGANAVMGDRSFVYNSGTFGDSTLRFYGLESGEQITDISLPSGSVGAYHKYVSSPIGIAGETGIYDGASVTDTLFVYPFSTGTWQQVNQDGYLTVLRTKMYGDTVAFIHDGKLKTYNTSSGIVQETGVDLSVFNSFDIWGKTIAYTGGFGIEVLDLDNENTSHLLIPAGVWLPPSSLAIYNNSVIAITPYTSQQSWVVNCTIE